MRNVAAFFIRPKVCWGVSAEPDFLAAVCLRGKRQDWTLDAYRIQSGARVAAFVRKESGFGEREDVWRQFAAVFSSQSGSLALALPSAMMRLETAAEQGVVRETADWWYAKHRQNGAAQDVCAAASAAWLCAYPDIFAQSDWDLTALTPDVCALFNAWLWANEVPQGLNLLLDLSWHSLTLLVAEGRHFVAHHHCALARHWQNGADGGVDWVQLNDDIHTLYRFFLLSGKHSENVHWYISGANETDFAANIMLPENGKIHYWCAADRCRIGDAIQAASGWQDDKHLLNRAIGAAVTEWGDV